MREIESLMKRLAQGTPLALARFNDGECLGIERVGSTVARGHQLVSQSLQDHLKAALLRVQPEYWIGLPCRDCWPAHRAMVDEMIPSGRGYLTSAVVQTNRNLSRWYREFPVACAGKPIVWVSGDDQDLEQALLSDEMRSLRVVEHHRVPAKDAWSQYAHIKKTLQLVAPGSIVVLSCGPLARVLASECFEERPDVSWLELGSTYDPFTKGVRHRCHLGTLPPCPGCN